MSILENSIDYQSLEGELHDAIKADALYQLQNDAKLRAIEQRVPTYDQFKDMVSAAHLKPMERSDLQPKLGVQWNSAASYANSRIQSSHYFNKLTKPVSGKLSKLSIHDNDELFEDKPINEIAVPKTTQQFLGTWKKLTSHNERFDYLLRIKPVIFMDIFRPEISLGILGEIIDTCLNNVSESDDVNTVIDILTGLSNCDRFQLSINFMSQEEKNISKQLFRKILDKCESEDGATEATVKMLRKRYQVTFDETKIENVSN